MGSRARIKPLGFLRLLLSLLISFAGLAGCGNSGLTDRAAAQTQSLQPSALNLGRIWKIEEGYYGEPHWVGVWTRRGETNVFDATWKHSWMNETKQDVVEVHLAKDGQVVVLRQGVNQHYRATYSAQHPISCEGGPTGMAPI